MRVATIRRLGFGAAFAVSLLFGARAAVADVNRAPYCFEPEPTVLSCIATCESYGDVFGGYNKQTHVCCCQGTN